MILNSGGRIPRAAALFVLVGALAASVGTAVAQRPLSPSAIINAESHSVCRVGMRVYESERGRQLLGEVIPGDFDRLLPGWSAEQADYVPSVEDLAVLADVSEPVDIICILGSWCHDSEREVPRFWKILEKAENPNLLMTYFAVGRSTDEKARELMVEIGFDENLRDVYTVELVPTFIFLKDDVELGRIVETPETTLEQDAARILSSGPGLVEQPAWR
jgi:thiol-disulfide isomerase/thioredoxin